MPPIDLPPVNLSYEQSNYTPGESGSITIEYQLALRISYDSVFNKIWEIVQDIAIAKLGIAPGLVSLSANLVSDIGLDSLEVIELIMEFEKTFNISIPDEDVDSLQTPAHAVLYLENRVKNEHRGYLVILNAYKKQQKIHRNRATMLKSKKGKRVNYSTLKSKLTPVIPAKNIYIKLKNIIAGKWGVDTSKIRLNSSFTRDLGADSLDVVELFMELEKEFNITIPDPEVEKLQTVAQTVLYLEHRMNKSNRQ